MRFWFQVWWRQDDGKTYAYRESRGSIGEAQKAHARICDRMADSDGSVVACGVSRLHCPPSGPWPRSGEQGREAVLVRSPEGDAV